MGGKSEIDLIGPWSEVKLDIIREYASAYSRILNGQKKLYHCYIDAFSGPGIHISKTTNEFVVGSPTNALLVEPPFKDYYFIDLDRRKVESLQQVAGKRKNVHIFEGDCNQLLIDKIFPQVKYEDFRRALCILDPYGLQLNWKVIATAGAMQSLEIFINFPIMDINRNVLHRVPDNVNGSQIVRMNAFWGDESWREVAYKKVHPDLAYRDELQ